MTHICHESTLRRTLLANLLPGLRELRAPLAAGYVWLLGIWLLFHDEVHKRHASGAIGAVLTIREQLGPVGLISAATFSAYVVGSLWEPIGQLLAEGAWRGYTKLRLQLLKPTFLRRLYFRFALNEALLLATHAPLISTRSEPKLHHAAPADVPRISAAAWEQLSAVAVRLFDDVDEMVRNRQGISGRDMELVSSSWLGVKDQARRLRFVIGSERDGYERGYMPVNQHELEEEIKAVSFGTSRERWWAQEARTLFGQITWEDLRNGLQQSPDHPLIVMKASDELPVLISKRQLTRSLFDELPLGTHRLVGEHQELFLEASRMKGEVEFRLAVAVPLVFAPAVAALGFDLPEAVAVALITVAVAAGLGLLFDGFRRDRRRNDFLVELLAIGRAGSPMFDRLLERAKTQTSPVGELDELDRAYWAAARGEVSLNPVPTILGISPPLSTASEGLTFILKGTGFIEYTIVSVSRQWDGEGPRLVPRVTRLVSKTELEITLLAEDMAKPGQLWISAVNPEPGGGIADPIAFNID